jgi:hypothetical protein
MKYPNQLVFLTIVALISVKTAQFSNKKDKKHRAYRLVDLLIDLNLQKG